jgi:hypothetical protein
MIFRYIEFLKEVKSSKLNLFRDEKVSNLFTSSIEIELETQDRTDGEIDYSEKYVLELITKIKNSTIKQLSRIEKFDLSEKISEFIDTVLEELQYEWEDYEYCVDKILEEDDYTDESQKLIIQIIKPQFLSYFYSDDFSYLEKKFKSNFKDFYSKYKKLIKFEIDNTLDRGIELSNLTYFENIESLIEFVKDFYIDYLNQDYWKFTDNTGIHINLGLKNTESYNPIKGLLFLNDYSDDPFVFKNMEWRMNSKFCGSLIKELQKDKQVINKSLDFLKSSELEKAEDTLNESLFKILNTQGYKNFGVNLIPLNKFNYIEFRYPGGQIEEKSLIDKLLYFSYVTYLMTNLEIDKKLYQKKLYLFLEKNSIQNASEI